MNVLLLNALTQVAPASYIKSENDKEQIMRAFCDNVLLAKRNRQKEEPVGALLLLLSIKDRLLRVHTAGNKALITDIQGSKVISKIKGYLRQGIMEKLLSLVYRKSIGLSRATSILKRGRTGFAGGTCRSYLQCLSFSLFSYSA